MFRSPTSLLSFHQTWRSSTKTIDNNSNPRFSFLQNIFSWWTYIFFHEWWYLAWDATAGTGLLNAIILPLSFQFMPCFIVFWWFSTHVRNNSIRVSISSWRGIAGFILPVGLRGIGLTLGVDGLLLRKGFLLLEKCLHNLLGSFICVKNLKYLCSITCKVWCCGIPRCSRKIFLFDKSLFHSSKYSCDNSANFLSFTEFNSPLATMNSCFSPFTSASPKS